MIQNYPLIFRPRYLWYISAFVFWIVILVVFSNWLIDWLIIASRPASSISPIFRRTNSMMYKQDYIEMREGVGQPILPATIKVRRVGSGRKKYSFIGLWCAYYLFEVNKRGRSRTGSVTLTNNVIHYGQQSGYLYYILTPHPLIERAPPMHNPATAGQR